MYQVYAKSDPEVLSCETGTPGYSFYFELIAELWRGCKAEGAIHRLCSLMRKMGARTLVKEELDPDEEIQQEFEDLKKRVGKEFQEGPVACRLSFFSASCPDKNWRELPESSFLGYTVVVRCKLPTDVEIVKKVCPTGYLSYLLEAITRPPGWACDDQEGTWCVEQVTNYYVHCQKEFLSTVGTQEENKDLSIKGVFFCQQNALTHVCAHAALRSILNTADGLVDHKITNRELNTILGIDHESKTIESGLRPAQIKRVADHLRLNMIAGDLLNMPTVDYAEWIYPLVESRYPVFLAFHPTHAMGHVVAVVGHTINSDKWDCEAHLAYRPEAFGTYHASSAWVDHFIVNDDNFGMYTCMPPSYLRNKRLPQYDLTQRATFAISFLPSSADVMPYMAEKKAVALVSNLPKGCTPGPRNRWLARLWGQITARQIGIVARTLMCKKSDYVANLRGWRDSDGKKPDPKILDVFDAAPDHLWVTEISLPDLYTANKHKLGDILMDTKSGLTGTGQRTVKLVWGWLPGIQLVPRDPFGTTIDISDWALTGHVPLLRKEGVLGPHREW